MVRRIISSNFRIMILSAVFLVIYSSACNRFLFQDVPYDETGETRTISSLRVDNQVSIEFGIMNLMVHGTTGYKLGWKDIRNPINGLVFFLHVSLGGNERLQLQERMKHVSYLVVTSFCVIVLSLWFLLEPQWSTMEVVSFFAGFCISLFPYYILKMSLQ